MHSPLTYSNIVFKLTNNHLHEAKEAVANAIAVCRSLYQANLDGCQHQIEEKYKTSYRLPILYLTQLMGLAFGARPRELGIQKLITSPRELPGSFGLM
jgi:heterodisulfide reductase subunit B2